MKTLEEHGHFFVENEKVVILPFFEEVEVVGCEDYRIKRFEEVNGVEAKMTLGLTGGADCAKVALDLWAGYWVNFDQMRTLAEIYLFPVVAPLYEGPWALELAGEIAQAGPIVVRPWLERTVACGRLILRS